MRGAKGETTVSNASTPFLVSRPSPSPQDEPIPSQNESLASPQADAEPEGAAKPEFGQEPNGVAKPEGVAAKGRINNPTARIRREINQLCDETYTRALAWCLFVHADAPHMKAEDLFSWLDEIGAKSPSLDTWNEYHRICERDAQKMVSRLRGVLRNNGIPFNV
jgi:hypothetical protein